MVDSVSQVSTGGTVTLAWHSAVPQIVEAAEVQDADSPTYAQVCVFPKGAPSNAFGVELVGGPTSIPGGQVAFVGKLTLMPDQELRGILQGTVSGDRCSLTVKVMR